MSGSEYMFALHKFKVILFDEYKYMILERVSRL